MRLRKLLGTLALTGCMVVAAPHFARAENTCSAGDQQSFDSCISEATATCAETVEGCSTSSNLGVSSSSDIVIAAAVKCCKSSKKSANKSCFRTYRNRARVAAALTAVTKYPTVKTVFRRAATELGLLASESDPCATYSVEE